MTNMEEPRGSRGTFLVKPRYFIHADRFLSDMLYYRMDGYHRGYAVYSRRFERKASLTIPDCEGFVYTGDWIEIDALQAGLMLDAKRSKRMSCEACHV